MRTTFITKPLEVERKWYVVDAEGQNLGRLCSQIAHVLKGKHKPIYSPNVDVGDYVIIINSDKVIVTGKKAEQKLVRRHTGHPGGLKEVKLGKLLESRSDKVIYDAVKGMLPKNSLGRKMLTKLRVYCGPEHEQQAQKPVGLALDARY